MSTNLSESEKKRYVRFQKYPFRARRGARRDQRTLKPRGAAASVNSTRGALRDGRGATKRSSKSRRQRRVCVSLSRRATPSARSRRARFVPPSTRRASLRDVEETKLNPGPSEKRIGAPMSRSPRTFYRREAPRRGAARGARRRSCARARTCWRATEAANHARGRARRCGAASRARKGFRSMHVSSQHARFPWLAVLAVTNFHVRGFFGDSGAETVCVVSSHATSRTRGKHR